MAKKKVYAEIKIKARLAFVQLFEAREYGGKKQYSVALLIPHGNKNAVKAINDGIKKAIDLGKNKYGWEEGIEKGKQFFTPLDDGDSKPKYEGYPGNYYMNTKNMMKPVCIDLDGEPLTPEELYSGCWANCIVHLIPYEHTSGGKGILASIQGVQKYKDDDSFGGAGTVVLEDNAFSSDFGDDGEGGFLG